MSENRIHDYFGYEVELNHEYGYIMFYGENEDKEDFINLIHEGLQTNIIEFESFFERLKRRYFAQLLRQFDDQDDYAITLIRSQFSHVSITDAINCLKEVNFSDLLTIKDEILEMNTAFVKMNHKR